MARAIVNDFGKSACYVSIGNLTSNLYIREVAESVQASVNSAIDEEVSAATAECDNKIGDLNRALEKAIEYLKMYKDMDLAQNESILNCPEETVSNWIAKIRAIAEGEEQYEEDDVNHVI